MYKEQQRKWQSKVNERVKVLQEKAEHSKGQPRNATSAALRTSPLTPSEMGRLWKVWTQEWQNWICIFSGVEASLQGAGWT